jgi:hypothetical protein
MLTLVILSDKVMNDSYLFLIYVLGLQILI